MGKIPSDVARWLKLAEQSKHNPNGPRVLPIEKINGKWYFVDERLHELRNVQNPHETMRFQDPSQLQHYIFWTRQLQAIVGSRVVSADLQYDAGFAELAPVIVFGNGKALMMLRDEEGNGAGSFTFLVEQ